MSDIVRSPEIDEADNTQRPPYLKNMADNTYVKRLDSGVEILQLLSVKEKVTMKVGLGAGFDTGAIPHNLNYRPFVMGYFKNGDTLEQIGANVDSLSGNKIWFNDITLSEVVIGSNFNSAGEKEIILYLFHNGTI